LEAGQADARAASSTIALMLYMTAKFPALAEELLKNGRVKRMNVWNERLELKTVKECLEQPIGEIIQADFASYICTGQELRLALFVSKWHDACFRVTSSVNVRIKPPLGPWPLISLPTEGVMIS
jgi:hypothetical protein